MFRGIGAEGDAVGGRPKLGVGGVIVFEDFGFDKDDNWFSFWWSTRWRFDNCIFTKKFIRGDLPPLDYSAHASHCTFTVHVSGAWPAATSTLKRMSDSSVHQPRGRHPAQRAAEFPPDVP